MTAKSRRRRRGKPPVRMFRMTVSSYYYDKPSRQLAEYEFYFKIARRARTRADIRRIRTALEEKGRRHYRSWLLRHLKIRLDRELPPPKFEREERARRQVEQPYASVRRLVMRKINRRWEPQELPSGTMRFARRRRRHAKS